MEWLQKMNEALDYLEEHLEGDPDLEQAARRAGCSGYHFQRIFSYLAGMPLGEYLRRRKMTRAALDLQGGAKVLDTALRYGYDSPTAFSRAFQKLHGVSPSAARRPGAVLKSYPPIRFQLSIKGVTEMEFRMEQRGAFRVIGLKTPMTRILEENHGKIPAFWAKTAADGRIPELVSRMDPALTGILGISACPPCGEWTYYIAAASSAEAPEGMEALEIAAGTWAVFPGKGPMPQAIQELERRIFTEWLPSSGWEYADNPDIERYLTPDPRGDVSFEVWLPIRRKSEK